jgi:hypothetical protein
MPQTRSSRLATCMSVVRRGARTMPNEIGKVWLARIPFCMPLQIRMPHSESPDTISYSSSAKCWCILRSCWDSTYQPNYAQPQAQPPSASTAQTPPFPDTPFHCPVPACFQSWQPGPGLKAIASTIGSCMRVGTSSLGFLRSSTEAFAVAIAVWIWAALLV